MAKFCRNCGRPLTDGEVCNCEQEKFQEKNNGTEVLAELKNFSEKVGDALDGIYDFISPSKRTGIFSNMIPFRNLIGLSKEDKLGEMGDCYEREKLIVPDLVQPCGQEVPIRQYELCSCRSLLRGLWQEGKLQVTNKRILFRLSGRNWVGKALNNMEFSLEEVAGVDITTSNKFSLSAFIVNIFYMTLITSIATLLVTKMPHFMAIFGLILFVVSMSFVRKHYYFKLAISTISTACFTAGLAAWESEFWAIAMTITTILSIVYLVMASLKPSLDFVVRTKCASSDTMQVRRVNKLESKFSWNMEVLPGKDAIRAMDELGTMVNDIQRFGDFGITKWKES